MPLHDTQKFDYYFGRGPNQHLAFTATLSIDNVILNVEVRKNR